MHTAGRQLRHHPHRSTLVWWLLMLCSTAGAFVQPVTGLFLTPAYLGLVGGKQLHRNGRFDAGPVAVAQGHPLISRFSQCGACASHG